MALTDPDARPLPAAPDLRAVDPDALAAARALAALLDGRELTDGSKVAARVAPDAGTGRCWLTSDDARMAVLALGGVPATLHPERVEAMVEALERVDPLLDAVEGLTGLLLEFTGADQAPVDAPAAELRWTAASGEPLAHLLLIPRSDWRAPADARPVATQGSAIVPLSRTVLGPRLSIEEASGIEAGDMLLLAGGSWAMTAAVDDERWVGVFDPDTGTMVIGQPGAQTGDTDMSASAEDDLPDALGKIAAFTVPISLSLPDKGVSAGELAALRPGSTLVLGPVAAGLDVELRVAGRPVASGELVRLGDAYAVLVTDVPKSTAAQAADQTD